MSARASEHRRRPAAEGRSEPGSEPAGTVSARASEHRRRPAAEGRSEPGSEPADTAGQGGGARREALHVREMRSEDDVFVARRLARDAAAALGMDTHGQVRFATALSEVARETLQVGGARITFDLDPGGVLVVALTTSRPLPAEPAEIPGLTAARRLVDRVELSTLPTGHSVIKLARNLSPSVSVDRERRQTMRLALERAVGRSPLDELRVQNADLLLALEELQAKQHELLLLNQELEETNKGVLALYGQLSAELDETNRGVVALYAELDERSVQLQQANDAKNRFLRSVSHELRTPVNSILGLARLLLDPDEQLDGEQRRQVELIRGSAAELLSRINQLLDVAKAESGRIEPVWADVDLHELFATLRGRIRPLLADDVMLVIQDPPAGRPQAVEPFRSDEGLLRDVLHNLLGNAVKFTEHGEIRMTAVVEPGGDRLAITVQDTGIGIAKEDQPKIFEEFYQVPGPAQARAKGSGLGLPYARRLATILGGTLTVASELGRGSTFTLWLPYQAAPPVRAAHALATPVAVALVVEDDPAFRAVLQGLLRPYAERVIEAADVAEALRRLAETVPTVVLLDLGLPGADGTVLLAAMAEDRRLQSVPVVVVTAADLASPVLAAQLDAAAAVLSKSDLTGPLLAEVLAEVVRGS